MPTCVRLSFFMEQLVKAGELESKVVPPSMRQSSHSFVLLRAMPEILKQLYCL